MPEEIWVQTGNKWCELIGEEIYFEEHRVFPAGNPYEYGCFLVDGRRCSADIKCNLTGIQCKWAYTNPVVDRFELAA